MTGRDNEINELSVIRRVAHESIPELPCETITMLWEGMDSRYYEVDGRWIFRFSQHSLASEQLHREACLLPRLRLHVPVPIPNYRHLAERETGNVFVAYEKIPGVLLTRERFQGWDNETQELLLNSLGRFLTQLHSFPVADAQQCGVTSVDVRDQLTRERERVDRELPEFLEPQVFTYLCALADEYLAQESFFEYTPSFLHGNLIPDHLLVGPNGELKGVLYFGDMCISDPAIDFLYLYQSYGVEFVKRLLKHYSYEHHRPLKQKMGFWSRWNEVQIVFAWLDRGRPDMAMKQRDRLTKLVAEWTVG